MTTLRSRQTRAALAAASGALVALFVAPALAQEGAPDKSMVNAPAADLPSARDIIRKYVDAVGGEAAIRAKTSRHTKAIIKYQDETMEGAVESYTATPNKMVYVVDVPHLGKRMAGFDGQHAWAISKSQGPQVVTGRQADQMKEQATFYSSLYPPELYTKVQTVARTTFEGVDSWKVALMTHSGTESVHYFDAATGLLIGTQDTREVDAETKVEITNIISDYKKFGDLMIATRNVQRMLGVDTVTTIQSVEFDNVNPEYFVLPREIAIQIYGPGSHKPEGKLQAPPANPGAGEQPK